jgi:hypothetical protein
MAKKKKKGLVIRDHVALAMRLRTGGGEGSHKNRNHALRKGYMRKAKHRRML